MGALSRLFKSVFIWTINVFMIDCTNREASTPPSTRARRTSASRTRLDGQCSGSILRLGGVQLVGNWRKS